jgi:alkyl sulfatase BDS1-like metallo-beta-lactamase superfamily hydrolase
MLEIYIDPVKSADIDRVVEIKLNDQDRSWALHVRRGVAEINENVPDKIDATIELPYRTFAMIMTGETTLPSEIETGIAIAKGNLEALTEVIDSFDKIVTDQIRPDHLHN